MHITYDKEIIARKSSSERQYIKTELITGIELRTLIVRNTV